MNIRTNLICSTMLGASLVAIATPAFAQDADAAGKGQIEEIVVTARKLSESLQSVPVSVTALTEKGLTTKQVTEVADLQRTAPSMSVATGGTGPSSIIYLAIRGQAQVSPNSLSDNAVGIYIDGVYVGRPMVGNMGLLDMASAEVLRGPQGTLFGRNTTGGALNLTTHQPSDRFEGYAKVGVGNYNQRVLEGAMNVPLGDEVSVRVAGRYTKHDGYFPNSNTGIAQGSVGGEYAARATVKWSPKSLPITLTVSGDYLDYKDTGNAAAVVLMNPAVLPDAAAIFLNPEFLDLASPGQLAFRAAHPELANQNWKAGFGMTNPATGNHDIDTNFNRNRAKSASATLTWDIGDVKLKSITAYRESNTADSLNLLGIASPIAFASYYKQNQFSEELQLSGTTGKLDWQTGLYYFVEKGTERSDAWFFVASRDLTDFRSGSTGAFAQFNYHVTDALRITAGIRYTWDTRDVVSKSTVRLASPDGSPLPGWIDPVQMGATDTGVFCQAIGGAAVIPIANCAVPSSAKFNYPAWLLSADYRVNDQIFVYAKTSGASLSGGFNSRGVPTGFISSFGPSATRDVEVGLKGDFLDRHLRTNLSAYISWQDKVQRIVNTVIPLPTGGTRLTQFVQNSGKVETKGVEFEVTALPWTGMELNGTVSYLDAQYVKGSRLEFLGNGQPDDPLTPENESLTLTDRSSEVVPFSPKWTWNVGATQTLPVGFGTVSLHLDYAYTTSKALDAETTANPDPAVIAEVARINKAATIRGYGLLNGRVAINVDQPNIEIALWGRNLLDKAWFVNHFGGYSFGTVQQFQGAPRTFGATATYRF